MSMGIWTELQIVQHAAVYPMLIYLLKISRSSFVVASLRHPVLSRVYSYLADNSLEIYMIHQSIRHPVLELGMPFPVNLAVLLFLTFAMAALVHRLVVAVQNHFDGKRKTEASTEYCKG